MKKGHFYSFYALGLLLIPISGLLIGCGCDLLIGSHLHTGKVGLGIGLFIDGVSLLRMCRYIITNRKVEL
jgi:hypothetical protein